MRASYRKQFARMMIAALAITALTSGSVRAEPGVTAPVAGKPMLTLGDFDLAALGYVMEEFFISGTARSYRPVAPLSEDGHWRVEAADSAPFKTRIVVIRPADPRKFNGAVAVEWLNVTLGMDLASDWITLHRELMRNGFAYIGVSAQKAGVEGGRSLGSDKSLKKVEPERYGVLSHPGDAFAYDIFSQTGLIARGAGGTSVLGPLFPQRVLAIGESQSAAYLTTYVNAVDSIAKVYDGFLIHSRFAADH